MNILAFDTSTQACTVGLFCDDQVKVLHQVAPMQQTALILPMIKELLDAFKMNLDDLDAIAYGCGPGSFTGIRIANTVAQGLSFATDKPILRISSLAIIAQTAFLERGWENCLVAVDARMGQVYSAAYSTVEKGFMELIGKEEISFPHDFPIPPDSNWYGAGDGFLVHKIELMDRLGNNLININPLQLPHANALLSLAKSKLSSLNYLKAKEAYPAYLR